MVVGNQFNENIAFENGGALNYYSIETIQYIDTYIYIINNTFTNNYAKYGCNI